MGLKLNLGCSANLFPEPWLNIDSELPDPGLVVAGLPAGDSWQKHCKFRQADVGNLFWLGPETVSEIRADFLLEHVHIDRVPDMLYEWCRILEPGGRLHAMVPDGGKYAEAILKFQQEPSLDSWMKFRVATFELLNPVEAGILSLGAAAHKSIWSHRVVDLLFCAQGFTVEVSYEDDERQGIHTLVIEATKTQTPAGKRPPGDKEAFQLGESSQIYRGEVG